VVAKGQHRVISAKDRYYDDYGHFTPMTHRVCGGTIGFASGDVDG
jgi:hypothetical protein